MKKLHRFSLLLVLTIFTVTFHSCEKEEVQPGEPPTADAGINQDAVVGSTVTLNGSAADPDDDELTYSWSITTSPSGSNATITNADSKNASFTPDVAGSYTVTLSVSDGVHVVTDEAVITVTEAQGDPPVAVIRDENGRAINEDNENNSITITQTYDLDGSASNDPDQDQLSFQWTVVSQPDDSNPELNNDTNAEADFVPDITGEYVIQLEVTDPNGNSNVSQVTIIAKADPMVINSDINEDTTLEDIFEGSDMPDYLVTSNVDVNAELTVEPGVVVHFEQDRVLKITSSGMINAEGTSDNLVVFTSANIPGEIRWTGVLIESSDVRNSLNNVEISWAGSDDILHSSGWKTAALAVGNGSKLKLNNTTITNSGDYGLFVHQDGDLGNEFAANSFENNEGYPVGLYADQVSSMDEATTFSGNKKDVVVVNKSTLTSDDEVEWNALNNARYYLAGDLTINALLRIDQGAEFELQQEANILVDTDGALIAKGTASNQIVFTTANEEGQIHWSGIIFDSSDARNELDYVNVSWAAGESNFYYGGWQDVSIGVGDNAKATITNSTVSNSKADGIFVHSEAEVTLNDLTFADNQGRPVVLSANQAVEVNEGFQFTNNAQDVIAIYNSDFTNTEKNTLVALAGDASYLVMSEIQVKEALNINAGATLKFTTNAALLIKDSGALNAEGNENELITFTANDTGNKWKGISIETNNVNNKLNYAEISYAGNDEVLYSGGWRKANVALDGTLEIQNSVITNSSGTGLFISNESTVNGLSSTDADLESTLLSQNTFEDNAESALTIQ